MVTVCELSAGIVKMMPSTRSELQEIGQLNKVVYCLLVTGIFLVSEPLPHTVLAVFSIRISKRKFIHYNFENPLFRQF